MGPSVGPKEEVLFVKIGEYLGRRPADDLTQGKRLYGSYWGQNMGPNVSLREETVLVQTRLEFGSMTGAG
jgi:hypothetical protein